jgi:flagellar protein FlgJ
MTAAITDFGQFSSLRAGAEKDDPAVLREVAGQFEALFIQTMFKNMRDTSLADPVFGQSDQHEMYQEMLDKQYALEMSSGRGIGLADMLVRQLGGEITPVAEIPREFTLSMERYTGTPAGLTGVAGPVRFTAGLPHRFTTITGSNEAIVDEGIQPRKFNSGHVGSIPTWSTPEDFAQQVWPYAEQAAKRLNVSPEALVAQAALETGWGEHVMQRPDGTSSLNLFGIKASHNWTGGTVSKPTIEYRDGIVRQETATFRAYPDLAATFDDYAKFIGEQPRYQSVTNHGDDTAGFASALQDAGYATDPKYADKITDILDSGVMRKTMQWLKENAVAPITNGHLRRESL